MYGIEYSTKNKTGANHISRIYPTADPIAITKGNAIERHKK